MGLDMGVWIVKHTTEIIIASLKKWNMRYFLNTKMKKDVVAGLGEIGLPMQKLLSRTISVVGYDKKTELVNTQKLKKFENHETEILHICIPFTKNFISNILVLEKKLRKISE